MIDSVWIAALGALVSGAGIFYLGAIWGVRACKTGIGFSAEHGIMVRIHLELLGFVVAEKVMKEM